ncbi:polysaccharide biosynthesis tyrosine autokinase [Actinoplanes sp. NPDC049596]|uniref:polysaccharide biosynthesis tyrosine autokinase n=1 Tax=Actinoplanes sp. NPDC049596 TaxID=3154625 RepID=UPI003436069D
MREYARACRRGWVWLVVPMLLAVGIATGLALSRPPAYRSTMVLFVTTGADDADAGASRLNSYIALLTGPRVAQGVVTKVGQGLTVERVTDHLTAQVQDGTDLLVVAATDPSAATSRAIVRTATTELVALVKNLGAGSAVSVAQDAVTTKEPDRLVRNVSFSAVLGLLIGAIVVAVREATRKKVTEEDDLRRLGIGTVGVIAIGNRYGRTAKPDEELAEAFRKLRSLLPALGGGTSLLLTGANRKEGTTAVACGLAIALAETGARVLLVDANLRSPGVSRYLSMEPGPGLAEVLTGAATIAEVLHNPLDGRLTVLPPGIGAADPGEALASPRLGATMDDLSGRFDVVLVDAPPLNGVADAAVLSKVTDGALLVVRANRTRTADVQRSADLLERVGAQLVGAVLNALPRRLPTGALRHRPPQVPADSPSLLQTLVGAPTDPEETSSGLIPAYPATARGRARVTEDPAPSPPPDDPVPTTPTMPRTIPPFIPTVVRASAHLPPTPPAEDDAPPTARASAPIPLSPRGEGDAPLAARASAQIPPDPSGERLAPRAAGTFAPIAPDPSGEEGARLPARDSAQVPRDSSGKRVAPRAAQVPPDPSGEGSARLAARDSAQVPRDTSGERVASPTARAFASIPFNPAGDGDAPLAAGTSTPIPLDPAGNEDAPPTARASAPILLDSTGEEHARSATRGTAYVEEALPDKSDMTQGGRGLKEQVEGEAGGTQPAATAESGSAGESGGVAATAESGSAGESGGVAATAESRRAGESGGVAQSGSAGESGEVAATAESGSGEEAGGGVAAVEEGAGGGVAAAEEEASGGEGGGVAAGKADGRDE